MEATEERPRARVVLRDGSQVLVRPVRRGDVPLLAEGFARLSAETRRLRFLTDKSGLSAAELRYFTEVDHHDHEALGALDEATGRGLGIARFIRDPDDPEVAEFAITVVDDWQRRGLGTELMTRLIDRAHQEGIKRFTALIAADNEGMIALLRSIGADLRATHREAGAVEYVVTPAPEGVGGEFRDLLRFFGQRRLRPPTPIRDALAVLVPDRFASDDED